MKTDSEVLAILESQIHAAMGGSTGGELSKQRRQAMDYYLGEPFGNEVKGRSQVVSTDVADTIEWILPSLLEVFCATEDAIAFEPIGQEDVEAAEQETDYVIKHLFFRKNDGFLRLYTLFKDALLQKTGTIKCFVEEKQTVTRESYENLTDEEFLLLSEDPDLEPVEHTERLQEIQHEAGALQVTLHDVVFKRTQKEKVTAVVNVPPEELLISKDVHSIDLRDAPFVAHRTEKTVSELLEMGFDRKTINGLPSAQTLNDEESTARNHLTDEQDFQANSIDDSMRRITVYECYIHMDYDDDGIAELRQIIKAGNRVLSNLPVENIPFFSVTPIILTHKYYGLSIADLVMDLQKIKSTLWRQTLDNIYLQNNQRVAVNETLVNLDDLMISRPGGIVRTKGAPGEAVMPLISPPLGSAPFEMIAYIDKVKEGRAGAGQTTAGLDANILNNNKGDASVERLMTAAEQRIKLIARIFAETGLKWLFLHMHELVLKHHDKQEVVELRNKWVPVNPQEWRKRNNMRVTVGLGTGDRLKQAMTLRGLMEVQQSMIQGGGLNVLVTPRNLYNTAMDMAKSSGIKNAAPYFTDPESPEAQQYLLEQQQKAQQAAENDPTQKVIMLEAQLEQDKLALKNKEIELKRESDLMRIEIEKLKLIADAQLKGEEQHRKNYELLNTIASRLTQLEINTIRDNPHAI